MDRAIHLLNSWGQRCLVKYRNPLLSIKPPSPPGTYLFQSQLGGEEGVGLNRPGAYLRWGLILFSKDNGFSHSERTRIQSEKPQVQEDGGHTAKDQ